MSETKKNILITGASGFVGRALVEKMYGISNLSLVSRDVNYKEPRAKVFYGNLSDPQFCKEIVSQIDEVFYLAGYKKNIAHHLKFPIDFVMGNVEPLISFLKAVKDSSIKKIVYLSSTNVGFYKDGEEDGYVVGKYINELLLKAFAKQSGLDVKIVRSVGIYGPGDNFNTETANFIPTIINKVYDSDKAMEVWGTGKREMQFVFIEDLVSNLTAILESGEKFFTVGNKESLTVNQIVGKIIELSSRNIEIKNDEAKPDKPSQLFDFNNAVTPRFNMNDGLKKTIHYYQKIKKLNA